MAAITLQVTGLDKIQRKLGKSHFESVVNASIQRVGEELVRKHNRSRKAGAKANPLSGVARRLSFTLSSSRRHPRRTGAALIKKNRSLTKTLAPRVLKKRIEEAWSQ